MSPRVRPASSRPNHFAPSNVDSAITPPEADVASTSLTEGTTLRKPEMRNPMVMSATAAAFFPGVVATCTPSSFAAARSMLTGPPRAQAMSLRLGFASSTSRVTGTPWSTSTSWPSTSALVSAGSPSYSRNPPRGQVGESVIVMVAWSLSSPRSCSASTNTPAGM